MNLLRAAVTTALLVVAAAPASALADPSGFQVDLESGGASSHVECDVFQGTLSCLNYSVSAPSGAHCSFGGTIWTVALKSSGKAHRTHTCVDEGFHGWKRLGVGKTFRSGSFKCRHKTRNTLSCSNGSHAFGLNARGRLSR
jgi:hypothetical protein